MDPESPPKCKHCPYTSRKKAAMLMHERMTHSSREMKATPAEATGGPRKRPDIVQFGDPSAAHVRGPNNECSLCPSDTKVTMNLAEHLRKHRGAIQQTFWLHLQTCP